MLKAEGDNTGFDLATSERVFSAAYHICGTCLARARVQDAGLTPIQTQLRGNDFELFIVDRPTASSDAMRLQLEVRSLMQVLCASSQAKFPRIGSRAKCAR